MNKLFKKIGMVTLGLSMVLGVGVGVASLQGGRVQETKAATLTDTITVANTDATGSTYVLSTFTSGNGVSYSANNGKKNDAIQLSSSSGNAGIVTTNSIGYVSSVTFAWANDTTSGRKMDVYGATSAYSSPSNLYSSTTQGTKIGSAVYGTSTTVNFSANAYTYIGVRSNSGAQYLNSVAITYITGGGDVVMTSLGTPSLSSNSVEIGSTVTASTTYAPVDTTESLTWTITGTNTDAATISNIVMADGAASITVTGTKVGSCTITATPTVTTALAKTSSALTVSAPTLTALTMSQTAADINKGDTLQLSVTPTPSSADASVTWSSNATDIATVDSSSGLVTANSSNIGEATITATSTTVPSVTATCVVSVVEPTTYALVTDISQLVSGDKVVIGGVNGSNYYAAKPFVIGGNNVRGTTATGTSGSITPSAEAAEYTIGIVNVDGAKYYTFNDGTGYLYAAAAGSNNMKTESTVSVNSEFAITLVDGVFTIQAKLSSNRNLMRFNYNGGSPLFSCYASDSTTGTTVSLYYKDSTAASVAQDIKTLAGGWDNPIVTDSCASNYAIAKLEVIGLSSGELEIFQNSSDTEIASARATYTHWCAVNGDSKPYDSLQAVNVSGNLSSDSMIIILVVVSLLSVTALGAFFFYKKRKENA